MAGVGLSYVLNILLIVHAMKTGRPYYWIFIIMTPVIGPLAYFLVELLPELSNDYRAKRAFRSIRKTLDPNADLRRHQKQDKLSDSVDAKRHLAAELASAGRYDEAIEHYEKALTGLYEHDPDLMLGLAGALFDKGEFERTRNTMNELIANNPDFKSTEGHLLFAKAVAECGDIEDAIKEYEVLSISYPGPEAKVRFAALLEQCGQEERALSIYDDVLNAADLAPRHFRIAQKSWLSAAKDGLQRLRE